MCETLDQEQDDLCPHRSESLLRWSRRCLQLWLLPRWPLGTLGRAGGRRLPFETASEANWRRDQPPLLSVRELWSEQLCSHYHSRRFTHTLLDSISSDRSEAWRSVEKVRVPTRSQSCREVHAGKNVTFGQLKWHFNPRASSPQQPRFLSTPERRRLQQAQPQR